jgi:hypothetical protein
MLTAGYGKRSDISPGIPLSTRSVAWFAPFVKDLFAMFSIGCCTDRARILFSACFLSAYGGRRGEQRSSDRDRRQISHC